MAETDFAEAMADQMTHCYASTQGCKRFPVRMIYEMSRDEPDVVDMVMLCPDHAATYKPEGEVLSDTMLCEGDNLKMVSEMRWP